MNEIQKKVLLDLLVNPTTSFSTVVGTSLLLAGWAAGSALVGFVGVMLLLIGAGVTVTSLICNFEGLTVKAIKALRDEREAAKNRELNDLDRRLVRDRDPRDQQMLRELRQLRQEFRDDMAGERLSACVPPEAVDQIEELFWGCVKSLEYVYKLMETAKGRRGKAKEKILTEREQVLTEVRKSVDQFRDNIAAIRTLSHKAENTDLAQLREQLNHSLEVARRAEQAMHEPTVEERYKEFLK